MNKEMINSFIYGNHKRTLLHKAAEIGDYNICKLLIDHGADVRKEDTRKRTPLFLAVQKGHVDICNVLIENGASVNIKDATGKTPLLIAASKSLEETCKILVLNGANPFDNDNFLLGTVLPVHGNPAYSNEFHMLKLWRADFGKMIKFFT